MTKNYPTNTFYTPDARRDGIADDSASMQELIIVLVSIAKRVSQTKNESEVKTNCELLSTSV
jgi:hypothetical protein